MPYKTEAQQWQDIVADAHLELDEGPLLQFVHYEIKRNVLFIRVWDGLELPPEIVMKITLAAQAQGLRTRLTGKWATMADLDLAVGEISWLWKDWIPREMITMLAGEAGTGKSQLALWFCKVVSEGLYWPDGTQFAVPGKVIFVDAESAQVITKERCINMGINMERVYVPNLGNDMLAQPDLSNKEHKEQIYNMVDELRPDLIVVDSLGGAKSGGENAKEDMQPVMLWLTKLMQNKGCALTVIHHLNKGMREEKEEIALSRLRGSTTIAQFARSVMFIGKKPNGTKLWIGKSNVAKAPEPFSVEMRLQEYMAPDGTFATSVTGFDFARWAEEEKHTKIGDCKRWIMEALEEAPNHSMEASELIELARVDMPFTAHNVKDAGQALEREGKIKRTGGKRSVWSLVRLDRPPGEA